LYIQVESLAKDPMKVFMYALKAPESRRQYPNRFKVFLDFLGIPGELDTQAKKFLSEARAIPTWAQDSLIRFIMFQIERAKSGEIAESTISNYYKATKLFCEMNELSVNWRKIARGIPKGRRAANDRIPTLEEIHKLLEYPDRRIKPIVAIMIASGIRIGAWDTLQWKHITPFRNDNGEVIAAKLLVYPGDQEEYYSFITPEAYHTIKEWMDFRQEYGEKISGDSWVMRDIWQTTNVTYGAKWGLATAPKKLHSSAIKRLIERALWEQGIRQPLDKGKRRHEWKAAHGFRKLFKTVSEQHMKPINVEILMGHNIGVSASYYRPKEHEVLEDYLRAADHLTINSDKKILEKQISRLTEKQDEMALMKLKHEKEMKEMDQKLNKIMSLVQQNPKLVNVKSEALKKKIK
jgi:integrase